MRQVRLPETPDILSGEYVIDAAAPVRVEVKAARRRMRKVRPGYVFFFFYFFYGPEKR